MIQKNYKHEKELMEIKEEINNFLDENKLTVFCMEDELLSSTELGKTQNKSPQATNLLLNKAGFLKENENKEEKIKWKVTEKGRKYAITPIKFITSITEENNVLIRLKKENPKWIGKIKSEFEKIVKENNEEEQ